MSAETATPPARSARKPRRKRRFRGGTAAVVLVGLLVALVAAAVLSGNYQIRPVLSGSMRPGLPVGGVVVTQKVPLSDIKVRDVIVFTKPTDRSELVVHRVIHLRHQGSTYVVRTQGDANAVADPWTLKLQGDTAYRVKFSLPLLGYASVWFHNAGPRNVFVAIGGLFLLGGAFRLWRSGQHTEPAGTDSSTGDGAERDGASATTGAPAPNEANESDEATGPETSAAERPPGERVAVPT